MRFEAVVELGGKTATGICVPDEVVTALGSGRRPAVRVTIAGYTYRTTVAVMGGRYLVPLAADNRAGAGVAAGDTIDVLLELDTEKREVTVPDDLAAALRRHPTAAEGFERLSYSNKRAHVLSVESAKTAETRQRRIDKAVAALG